MSNFGVISREDMMYHFFEVMRTDPMTEWVTGFSSNNPDEIDEMFGPQTIFYGDPQVGFASVLDVGHDVAMIHLYLLPQARKNYRFGVETLFQACEWLKQAGYRKVVVTLTQGNPLLRPNREVKIGFRLAGVLEKHVRIHGEYRDSFLYERFL